MNQPTAAELASIDASIAFMESLDSRIAAVSALADRSASNGSTIRGLGSHVGELRHAVDELSLNPPIGLW